MGKKVEKREVCRCENCGNEAEMVFTCTLPDLEQAEESKETAPSEPEKHPHQVKGSATCTHCGNEADMWIDY
jgi:DNA-directed RNA polymerase subunit M/transcription elongation factor TFIIS